MSKGANVKNTKQMLGVRAMSPLGIGVFSISLSLILGGCGESNPPAVTTKTDNSIKQNQDTPKPVVINQSADQSEIPEKYRFFEIPSNTNSILIVEYQKAAIGGDKRLMAETNKKIANDKDKVVSRATSDYCDKWKSKFFAFKNEEERLSRIEKDAEEVKNRQTADNERLQKKKDEALKKKESEEKVMQSGGFSIKEINVKAIKTKEMIETLSKESVNSNLEKCLELSESINDALREINGSLTKPLIPKDYKEYYKIKNDYLSAITNLTKEETIKSKRLTGKTDQLLKELTSSERYNVKSILHNIMRENSKAFISYLKEVKSMPKSEKDLSDGYETCKWKVPFLERPLPEGEREIVLLSVNNSDKCVPLIVCNPAICNGITLMSFISVSEFSSGINYDGIRTYDGEMAITIWKLVETSIKTGKPIEKSMWPKEAFEGFTTQ